MTTVGTSAGLLEGALAYTRMSLAEVTDEALPNRTPCQGWTLDHLLDHMTDSLTAYTEASRGAVPITPTTYAAPRLDRIRDLACHLLGAWLDASQAPVLVGHDRWLDPEVLLAAASLEITLHGWDVAVATGHPRDVPESLARGLLAWAPELVGPRDLGGCFGRARLVPVDAPVGRRLLAYLGRPV